MVAFGRQGAESVFVGEHPDALDGALLGREHGAQFVDAFVQGGEAFAEEAGGVIRPDDLEVAEGQGEREVRVLDDAELRGDPRGEDGAPLVGEVVGGARRAVALLLRANRLDEAALGEAVHLVVERRRAQLDPLILLALTQRLDHLVGVHVPLVEQGEDGDRQRRNVRGVCVAHARTIPHGLFDVESFRCDVRLGRIGSF